MHNKANKLDSIVKITVEEKLTKNGFSAPKIKPVKTTHKKPANKMEL